MNNKWVRISPTQWIVKGHGDTLREAATGKWVLRIMLYKDGLGYVGYANISAPPEIINKESAMEWADTIISKCTT